MGAFDPQSNLCQKRKENKGAVINKSFSGSLVPEDQRVAKVLSEKEYQPAHLSFLLLTLNGNFGNRQIKGFERTGHQWKCWQLCSESGTALGEIYPLSLFDSPALSLTPMHSLV